MSSTTDSFSRISASATLLDIHRSPGLSSCDRPDGTMTPLPSRNVLGGPLRPCSHSPRTGFFRNGHCDTCADATGCHTVCVEVTDVFLEHSRDLGNDLSTPRPDFHF